MTLLPSFQSRVDEVRALLKAAEALEREQQKAITPSIETARMLASARASAFLMIYNAVEFVVRQFITSVRSEIQTANRRMDGISDYWRGDIVKHRFLQPLQSGVNYGDFVSSIKDKALLSCEWHPKRIGDLPFSGNISAELLREFIRDIGIRFKAPRGTLGGSDLDNIRAQRNALAHGLESFETTGNATTAKSLLDTVDRIDDYFTALIVKFDDYLLKRDFII